jgi:ribosomal protein L11 methyltransferase
VSELAGFALPGPLRERLSGLVLAGRKTATFDLYDLARFDPHGVPTVGGKWTMHDSHGRPLAHLETVSVQLVRMADVQWQDVDDEGESFTSVTDWRDAHEAFWTPFVDEIRTNTGDPTWHLNDDTIVVCEHFGVAERLAAADEGRYPVVEFTAPAVDAELAAAELFDLDTIGIEELGSDDSSAHIRFRAGFASDEAAANAEAWIWANYPLWTPRFEVILGDDWLDTWREHFVPITVGGLIILPDWGDGATVEVPPGVTPIRLDPKRAWGTGAHASTGLVLQALQSTDVATHNRRVLDVGCGSGILAIASLLLGAASAHGIDVERSAIPVTLENAARNGVVDRCTAEWEPIATHPYTYDLVLANILAPVLIDLAPDIVRVTEPNGTIVLAGLIDTQVDRVVNAFSACQLVVVNDDGAWRSLILRRMR